MSKVFKSFSRQRLGFAGALILVTLTACAVGPFGAAVAEQGAAKHVVHWSYTGAEGPAHWAELEPDFALCSTGGEQSPIDIRPGTSRFMKADWLLPLSVKFAPSKLHVVNNGHTIQVNYDKGTTFSFEKRTYQLAQFHFHAPSEHTLNGQAAAMEMHLVFATPSKMLAVIGFWLVEGAENPFLAKFWHTLPDKPGATEKELELNAGDALPANREYWHYDGSLTTPACAQGVKWFVLKGTQPVSRTQVAKFVSLFPEGNARPTQPVGERLVKDGPGGTGQAAAAH